ncbi:MAG: Ig-like domain-containing protein [Bacteroidales bacterium]|nr:Ig-like domain-containing protein [Bacteroidales bacterium]
MKTLLRFLFVASSILLFFSSCKGDKEELVGTGVKTLDAKDVTESKALLCGLINAPDPVALDFEFGFEISMEPVFTTESTSKVQPKYYNENHEFSYQLENLMHASTYHYRAYMINQMMLYHGEVKSFTTGVIPVESVSLDRNDYTFNAIGNSLNLRATILPSDATNKSIEWSSNNENVATVDSYGRVIAQGNGRAIITVKTVDQEKTDTCAITVKQLVTSIAISNTSLFLVVGEEDTLSVTSVLPDNAYDKTYTWTSSDNSVATVDEKGKVTAVARGTAIIKATANDGSGVSSSCQVLVRSNSCPDGAVDLGLSVYWSTCNLSESGLVNSPEVYGDYFAWGETSSKLNVPYDWSSYKWCNGSSTSLTKYNIYSSYGTVDNKTTLDSEDDVAHVILGGSWRMPTDAEWRELLEKCSWTWTSNYNGTGVAGRIVTSNVEGYKDKSIFLPAAGGRSVTSLSDAGSRGYYWSSSLLTDYPGYAWNVVFYSGYASWGVDNRYFGFSVRPVSE